MVRPSTLSCALAPGLFATILSIGCSAISLEEGPFGIGRKSVTDAGADAAIDASGPAEASGTRGIDCGVDRETGVQLCMGVSLCPTVRVDPDLSPACGFRLIGNVFDMQCLCSDGSLCPMGTVKTCADAARLVQTMSALEVCRQRFEGRCAQK
jgi:hypothetical protein